MAARNYATGLEATLKRLVEGNGGDGEDVSVLINLERLGWALDIVHSRSLTVDMGRDDPRGVRRFLIPLVDFLNHAGDGCAFTYDEKDDPPSFIIELKEGDEVRAPSPKQQLHLDYGDKTCEELWLMYGFVPDAPTPYDAVTLDGAYSDEDVAAMEAADAPSDMLEEKRHLLESNRYGPPRCFGITGRQVDPAIVCALRLMFLTADELRDECNGNWNRPLLHAPVSLDNERLVASSLQSRLGRLLSAEPTTLEQDERLLDDDEDEWEALGLERDDPAMVEETRCAVQLRANRKRLIKEMMDRLDGFIGLLEDDAQPSGSTTGAAGQVPNLLACLEDYMPGIRLV